MQTHSQLGEAAYRAHPYLANSMLSKLVSPWLNVPAFRFGTLTHSVILEPKKVNFIAGTIIDHDYTYRAEEIRLALAMRDAFISDEFCRALLAASSVEVEMYNQNTRFENIAIDTKRKYDMWIYSAGWGADIKSTTATTQTEFLHHIEQFDYDRGRVFYAKGSGAKQDVIIGIGKTAPHRIYKVFMKEGCPLWTRGTAKVNHLAKMYHEQNPPF